MIIPLVRKCVGSGISHLGDVAAFIPQVGLRLVGIHVCELNKALVLCKC